MHAKHVANVDVRLGQLAELLTEGILTEDYVLDNSANLLNVLRLANADLRWLMLHIKCRNKKLKDVVTAGVNPEKVLLLLLHTAQLEFKVGFRVLFFFYVTRIGVLCLCVCMCL